MRDSEVFELSEDDLPLTIHIYNKDGVEVDTIDIEDAGVLELPVYPDEGKPYSVKLVSKEGKPKRKSIQKAYSHQGWKR